MPTCSSAGTPRPVHRHSAARRATATTTATAQPSAATTAAQHATQRRSRRAHGDDRNATPMRDGARFEAQARLRFHRTHCIAAARQWQRIGATVHIGP